MVPKALQLHITSAPEGGGIIGLGKAQRVPKAHGRLHAQLGFLGEKTSWMFDVN